MWRRIIPLLNEQYDVNLLDRTLRELYALFKIGAKKKPELAEFKRERIVI